MKRFLAFVSLALATTASAQTYPNRAVRTSRCSLSTMSMGVFAGANIANQPPSCLYCGNPASAVVGTSGADGWRFSPV